VEKQVHAHKVEDKIQNVIVPYAMLCGPQALFLCFLALKLCKAHTTFEKCNFIHPNKIMIWKEKGITNFPRENTENGYCNNDFPSVICILILCMGKYICTCSS